MNNRLARYFTLLLLVVTAACSDDDPDCLDVTPEAFRFRLVDQAGNNRLTADERPDNIRIFYLRNTTEVSLQLEFEGSGGETYGISSVLPYISIYQNADTYFLERGNNIDTILVRASERSPGNQCAGFSYDEVAFNGVAVTLDDTVDPAVYVLVE